MYNVQQHLQREGRACYKRREYKRALEFFDSAVGRAPSVQLLDNRAACHDKLNDLPAALRDAKKAIQLQKDDPTGYLRAGKILVKMEKPSVAFEIYAHGLKVLKTAGQGYELLRTAYGELMSQLSPPKSVDPLTILPRELAEFILEYLTFQQRINVCLVSKQWATFVRTTPNLWRHLDVGNAIRKVRTAFISRAINVGRQKLTKATLSNLHDFNKTLAALTRHCPLEDLTLLDTGLQSQNLVESLRRSTRLKALRLGNGTLIGEQTFHQLLRAMSASLETLECQIERSAAFQLADIPCDRLTTLRICAVGVDNPDGNFFGKVATFMPNLRSLTAHQTERCAWSWPVPLDLAALDRLECLDLKTEVSGSHRLKLPTSLQTLRLSSRITRFSIEFAPQALRLPRLIELSIELRNSLDVLRSLLATDGTGDQLSDVESSLLETLGVSTSSFSGGELQAVLEHRRLRQLKHLELQHFGDIDGELEFFSKKLLALESIDIGYTSVTGVGVRHLVGMPRLKRITVNGCPYLGRDAIEWAQTQGVVVLDSSSNRDLGGRKVRY